MSKPDSIARGSSKAEGVLQAHGGVLLVVSGVLLVLAGMLVTLSSPAEAAAITIGAGMAGVGILLPNLEGAIKVGPGGFEAVLREVQEKAQQRGLDEEEQALVLGSAFRILSAQQDREGDRAGRVGDALVDGLIREFEDTAPVALKELPGGAIEIIRQEADVPGLEPVEAQRRMGRGAPRWHIKTTDGSWWRVSNTRHGWSATPVEPPK